jgi:exodeoxyribonuclease VII small subunit
LLRAEELQRAGAHNVNGVKANKTHDHICQVVRLEDGRLPLEESIALYERGVALHEHCGQLLAAAELRVQRLVDAAGGSTRTLDLRPGDEDDDA